MKVYGPFAKIYDKVKDTFEYKLQNLSIELTENVLKIMENKGINRNDLAKKLGVSRASVTQFFNEGSNITIKRLLKISEALDCEIQINLSPKANTHKIRNVIEGQYNLSYSDNYSNLIILDDYRKGGGNETACG